MGAKFWTQEEKEYFLKEVLPKSRYSKGYFTPDEGQSFGDLALMMQKAMASRGIKNRKYTEEIMFQHWYQKINVRMRPGPSALSSSAASPNMPKTRINEGDNDSVSKLTEPAQGEAPGTGENSTQKDSSSATTDLSLSAATTAATTSPLTTYCSGTTINDTSSPEISPPFSTNPDEQTKSSDEKRPHGDACGCYGEEPIVKSAAKKPKAATGIIVDGPASTSEKKRCLVDLGESDADEPSTKKQKAIRVSQNPELKLVQKELSMAEDGLEIIGPPGATGILYQENRQRHLPLTYSTTHAEQPLRLPITEASYFFQPPQSLSDTSTSPNKYYPRQPQVASRPSNQGTYQPSYSNIQPRLRRNRSLISSTSPQSGPPSLPSRQEFKCLDTHHKVNHSPYQPLNAFINCPAPSRYHPRWYDDAIQRNSPCGSPHSSSAFPIGYPPPHHYLVDKDPSRPSSPFRSFHSHPATIPVRSAQDYSPIDNNFPPACRRSPSPPSAFSSDRADLSPKPGTNEQTVSPKKGPVRLAGGLIVMMSECPCCDRIF